MRSTKGKTRATRRKPQFTEAARVTMRATSTETTRYGSRELPAGVATTEASSRQGTGWNSSMNTNTQLCRGGISSYYRPRERGYAS